MIKVSVIIPAYNCEQTIEDSIESVLSQTMSEIELIIVNDCSTDATSSLLEKYKNYSFFKIIELSRNVGAAEARNIGINQSNSNLIAILDADDVMKPSRLEKQYDFFQNNTGYVIVGTNARIMDKDGVYIYTTKLKLNDTEIRLLLPETPFIHPSIMFDKNAFLKCGGYPKYMRRAQDTVMINRILKHGKGKNLESPLTDYRITPGSNSLRNLKDRAYFKRIVSKAIEYDCISKKDKSFIKASMQRNSDDMKMYYYHLILSKKYLWNASNSELARRNLKNCFLYKITLESTFLWILTFLPTSVIIYLYQTLKKGI